MGLRVLIRTFLIYADNFEMYFTFTSFLVFIVTSVFDIFFI